MFSLLTYAVKLCSQGDSQGASFSVFSKSVICAPWCGAATECQYEFNKFNCSDNRSGCIHSMTVGTFCPDSVNNRPL